MDFSGAPVLGVDLIGQKRMRSLKDIYEDPRSDKRISPTRLKGPGGARTARISSGPVKTTARAETNPGRDHTTHWTGDSTNK